MDCQVEDCPACRHLRQLTANRQTDIFYEYFGYRRERRSAVLRGERAANWAREPAFDISAEDLPDEDF